MSAALQAGNTVVTLASSSADTSTPVSEVENTIANRLAEINANFAKNEADKAPKPSAYAHPTGPAPVEWKEPALGGKSAAYPESKLDGSTSSSVPYTIASRPSVSTFKPRFVEYSKFEELLERIEQFNSRSSQKI